MAQKEALRELQGRLAQRMQSVQTAAPVRSWLAVECGGHGLLFPLEQSGEIHALAPIQPVPHVRPWFLGVANLRGGLFGVIDLARFIGLPVRAEARTDARLVGLNTSLEVNATLLVDALAGLRNEAALTPEPPPDDALRPAFVGARYRDAEGRLWQEILLGALSQDAQFRQIAAA